MNGQTLTLKEYVALLFIKLQTQVTTAPHTTNNLPEGFPISRGTYFNWKKGKGVRTCTIYKVCEYLKIPEPKIFL
jgi:hypothetical protein